MGVENGFFFLFLFIIFFFYRVKRERFRYLLIKKVKNKKIQLFKIVDRIVSFISRKC